MSLKSWQGETLLKHDTMFVSHDKNANAFGHI